MTAPARAATAEAVASVVADARPAMVARLIRVTGDWDLAEDCVQDAVERALRRWPSEGVPHTPVVPGWYGGRVPGTATTPTTRRWSCASGCSATKACASG